MSAHPIGVYERAGVTREAYTPGDVTQLRADGWTVVQPGSADRAPAKPKRPHKKKEAQ